MTEQKSDVEKKWDEYVSFVYEYAEEQFIEVVKPWLKSSGLNFTAGMGIWFLSEREDDGSLTNYHLPWDAPQVNMPEYVQKVLEQNIPGLPANDLGSLMPDYDYWVDVANNGE